MCLWSLTACAYGGSPHTQGVGREAAVGAGDSRRVAQGPGHLALFGAHLLLTGHHGPDARGGTQVQPGGQELERHHETG